MTIVLPPGYTKPCDCQCHIARAPQDIPEGDDDDPVPPGCFPYHALRWKNHTKGRDHKRPDGTFFRAANVCFHCLQENPDTSQPCREVFRSYARRGCRECLPDRRARDLCDQCGQQGAVLHPCPVDSAREETDPVCCCCDGCMAVCRDESQ